MKSNLLFKFYLYKILQNKNTHSQLIYNFNNTNNFVKINISGTKIQTWGKDAYFLETPFADHTRIWATIT